MAIFPISNNTNIDKLIISHSDIDSQLNLILVNRAAFAALSNEHFKKLFATLHPHLAKSPFVFQVLKTFHPSTCWKVACWALAKPYRQMTNLGFLKEAPSQLVRLAESNAQEYKKICGSHYKDPASPIHQAWLARESYRPLYEKNLQIMKFLGNVWENAVPHITSQIHRLDPEDIIQAEQALELFLPQLDEFRDFWRQCPLEDLSADLLRGRLKSFEGYDELLEHGIEVFDNQALLSLCEARQFLAVHDSFVTAHSRYCRLEQDFQRLVRLKNRAQRHQEEIAQDIALFPAGGGVTTLEQKKWLLEQHNLLVDELEFARDIETYGLDSIPQLKKCEKKIEDLLRVMTAHPEAGLPDSNSEEVQDLRAAINALPMSGRIWHSLYVLCETRIQEPQWSEKHFHEHLGQLFCIVVNTELVWASFHQNLLEEGITPRSALYYRRSYRNGLLLPRQTDGFKRAPHIPDDEAALKKLGMLKRDLLNQLKLKPTDAYSSPYHFEYILQDQPAFESELIDALESID